MIKGSKERVEKLKQWNWWIVITSYMIHPFGFKLNFIVFCCHLSRRLPVQEALRPPAEGPCLPWTPPPLHCRADAQPVSL